MPEMPGKSIGARAAAPTCATCQHCVTLLARRLHDGMPARNCLRRSRRSVVHGVTGDARTAEFERSRIWRWFGADTCGPEGRYWKQGQPAQPPGTQPSAKEAM
ncbi:hypothetical protein NX02_22095 [Sphingomonas sanxanigenens DSM 19645 = NX02]|uniref:Uncharacterized protein n=1 Tax=Sphingomonas sanxanigenens DSM 19645 = NX02 TaxID=1123269 RepID=W0A8G1_9SPHN|nr:hypothetical protein NX02_04250 [Sphingomonas sanxanigenens DSM 19645 = NX02]AHE56045.1 hypothetical protein NX02_22095 [Sphingomonas sanxanigenens DSM 19645 = NX02]